MSVRKQFLEEISKPNDQIDIETCALLFAAELQPDLNVLDAVLLLDAQVNEFLVSPPEFDETGHQNARFLTYTIGNVLEYRGDSVEYHSADNSLLNKVIEARLGMPITLAAIYVAVGKRLGITVHGVGFPGHFLVRIMEADGAGVIVDPFTHTIIPADRVKVLEESARISYGDTEGGWTANTHPHNFLLRILQNLKATYLSEGKALMAMKCLHYQLMLKPDDQGLLEELQALLRLVEGQENGGPTIN
jgi:regulator of sirC expression with transglutaminase-like and TPR domain